MAALCPAMPWGYQSFSKHYAGQRKCSGEEVIQSHEGLSSEEVFCTKGEDKPILGNWFQVFPPPHMFNQQPSHSLRKAEHHYTWITNSCLNHLWELHFSDTTERVLKTRRGSRVRQLWFEEFQLHFLPARNPEQVTEPLQGSAFPSVKWWQRQYLPLSIVSTP